MDLLAEAKKSNKEAFYELVNKYNHIFYKTARVFFTDDKDIYPILEKSLLQAFKDLVNVKNEREFLCWTLRIIIFDCTKQKEKFSKDYRRKLGNREIAFSITDKVTISESTVGNLEYQAYRNSSVVEEYITSIEPASRIPSLLYFYANLSIEEISKILKDSENEIKEIIDKSRIKIYEMIKNKEVDL